MGMINFYTTTLDKYKGLGEKNADSLYFLDDVGQLYKGENLIGSNIKVVEGSFPGTGEKGFLYIHPTNGQSKFWDGTKFVELTKQIVTSISGQGNNNTVPTTAAVKALVDSLTPEGYDELVSQVNTNKNAIAAINNSSTGILKQAKDYTDTLANGQVATNKSDIATLKTDKANKATTLAGYGIGDAYTKAQTDSAIATAVANADHLKREIVKELPSVGSADENTIYMVGTGAGSQDSVYEEYILINGAFEKIGTSEVDLTNYATKTEVSQAKTEAINTAKSYTDSKISAKVGSIGSITVKEYVDQHDTTTLNSAKSYADGLADNYATAAQGVKADSAVQKAQVTEGKTNGTIAVQGTDVAVHGLKSAAFAESNSFDAAGSANTALSNAKKYVNDLLTWKTIN